MYFDQVAPYILARLEEGLSPKLCYHSLSHTRDEVVPAVKKLAEMEGIHDTPLKLLLTAAWFHDIGYIVQPVYHELLSVRIAAEVLPGFGYNAKQIEVVRWAILSTILPQMPQTPCERVLSDADLDILGSENFFPRNIDLRRELANLGKEFSDEAWYQSQVKFLEAHHYFTESAQKLRDRNKQRILVELRERLEEARLTGK